MNYHHLRRACALMITPGALAVVVLAGACAAINGDEQNYQQLEPAPLDFYPESDPFHQPPHDDPGIAPIRPGRAVWLLV